MAKAIGYMKPDIDPNTRLYVPFNEGIGNIAKDYSQYGNHAQLMDVEWSPEGFNGSGKFNGNSSYGNCGNIMNFAGTTIFSISFLTKTTYSVGNNYILGTGINNGIYARIMDDTAPDNYALFIKIDDGINDAYEHEATTHLNDGNQHHILVICDTVNISGSVDGNKEIEFSVGSIGDTDGFFIIGGIVTDSGGPISFFFYGTINEVRIYNRALSVAQNAADCYEVVCS